MTSQAPSFSNIPSVASLVAISIHKTGLRFDVLQCDLGLEQFGTGTVRIQNVKKMTSIGNR